MTEPADPETPHIADLSLVDPDAITLLFERDPELTAADPASLDRLILELRRRAASAASDKAREEAAPKTATGRKRRASSNPIIDAALAAIADKPVDELSLDDLGPV